MPSSTSPHIGLFDSGIGGLSVLLALRRQLPQARITYVADSLHTPWGDRPAGWVVARSLQLSAWLLDERVDLVLVACNTATTLSIAALRARWPTVRFVGVEPGIKPAVAASIGGRIAVLATRATLGSERLEHLIGVHATGASLLRLPCPGLAEAIEQAGPDDPVLGAMLDKIAADLTAADCDTVVLGCTHYPLIADALAKRLPPGLLLMDTAQAVSRRVMSLLGGACRDGHPHAMDGQRADVSAVASPPLLRLLATGSRTSLQRASDRWLAEGTQVEALTLADPSA
jgi:glutamate racemase